MEAVREVAERVATPDKPVARGVYGDLADRAAARDGHIAEPAADSGRCEKAGVSDEVVSLLKTALTIQITGNQ